jgi:hypothetical protein
VNLTILRWSQPPVETVEAAPAHQVPSSALLPTSVCHLLSSGKTDQGSLLAFAWRDVASRLNAYPGHYNPAFAFSQLFCPPPYQLALRFTFPFGKGDGFTTFR